MAKVKIHELAKEYDIKSKDIVEFLASKGIEVKAQSGIEGDTYDMVVKKFGKKETAEKKVEAAAPKKAEEKKAEKPAAKETPTKESPAKEGNSEEKPKKKKNVTAVFNSQFSSDPRIRGDRDRNNRRNDRRDDRKSANQDKPARGRITVRPESERTARPSHRIQEERDRKEAMERKERREAAGANKSNPSKPIKPRKLSESERPSSRHKANDDDFRPSRNENKPSKKDDFRGNNFKKESVDAAPMDTRPSKDGRNNRDDKRKKHDYDKDKTKKQERYVNLEKNGGKKKNKPQPKQQLPADDEIRTITLPDTMTVRELADKMKIQPSMIVKKLFMKGVMITVNHDIDFEQAEEIALEFNYICEHEVKVDVIEELLKEEEEDVSTMVSRPPVVCVMGHVDHGKTSLLDAIRNTKVTDREAGGITQHIGAYMVPINGQKITFLDTPGHEAFTAMRMRGANSTDIAILVVAADDGVMPQTVEAINHAKAAGIEIIVAINKIDKPSANIERVKQELSEYELIPEDWGGSTIFCPVSAHTGEGIDNLLEMILLTSEVLELKANPKRNARGLVIEARLDKGRGTVATVLVQKGTLHVGDPIAAGSSYGKVRAMVDENGKRLKAATPSTPVEIIGFSEVPNAGEIFVSMDSEKEARSFAETFISEGKNKLIEETKSKMSLDDLFSQIQSGNVKELDLIVKADVQGSVEAVKQSLVKLSNDEVVVKVIHGGVGAINESDVILASASNAIIIGFNVRPDAQAKQTADSEGVDIRLYSVIYNAIEDVEAAMKGMLDPIYEEQIIGHAEVRQIFKASDVGNIAGSYILDGRFERGCKVRVQHEGEQVFEGDLASLKRFKDDVKEVKAGYECGLVVDGFSDFAEGDVIESYIMVEVPR